MNTRNLFGIIPILVTICVLIQITCIWLIDFIPFQDFYDWVYQSMVLKNIWSGDEFASSHFEIGVGSWHQPNALVTFLLAIFQFIVAPEAAGKLLLTLIIFVFVFGGYRLIDSFSPNNPFRFIPLLISFHFFFYKGFLSFCMGMGLFLIALSILKSIKEPFQKGGFFLVTSIILFYTHGFVFGVFCFVGLMCVLLNQDSKSSFSFKQLLPLTGFIPSLFLLWRYLSADVSGHEQFLIPYHSFLQWAQVLRYGLSIISRFGFTENLIPLSFINLGFLVLLGSIIFIHWKKIEVRSPYGIIFLSLSAMMIFNPFFKMGVFEPLSSRLTIILVVMGFALFTFNEQKKKIEIGILSLALILSALHFIHLKTVQPQFSEWIKEVEQYRLEDSRTLIFGKQSPKDFDKKTSVVFSGIEEPYLFLNSFFDVRDQTTSLHYLQLTGVVVPKSEMAKSYYRLETNLIDSADLEPFIKENLADYSDNYDRIILLKSVDYSELFKSAFSDCFKSVKNSEQIIVLENLCSTSMYSNKSS